MTTGQFIHSNLRTFRIYFILLVSIVGLPTSAATPVELSLFTLDSVPDIKNSRGYLLIDLALNTDAASLHFIKLKSQSNQTFLFADQKIKKTGKEMKLNFNKLPNGLYGRSLAPGVYQITRVDIPYFDFPYRVNTSDRRIWRFNIEAGKTNYIGQLAIAGERSTDTIDVRWLNRFATDYDRLTEGASQFPAEFPLVLSHGVQDEFDAYVNKESE